MVNIVIFGQGMQLPIVIPCDVELDMSDSMTITMASSAIIATMQAVLVARGKYEQGQNVGILVQAVKTPEALQEPNPEDN